MNTGKRHRVERRLAAILAADVAGYSRLMGVDEEETHRRLNAHLEQLFDPKIREHHGRTVKTTGDGLLAEFASVVDAVRCAAEIQRAMIDRNAEMAEDRRITFRLGINLGDIIIERDDIFGDGVNIAARLEALAEPGGICISATVHDHIGDRLPYAFDDMGRRASKISRGRCAPTQCAPGQSQRPRSSRQRRSAAWLRHRAGSRATGRRAREGPRQSRRHVYRSWSCHLPICRATPSRNISSMQSLTI